MKNIKFFSLAALLIASATFVACSSDNDIIGENQQPANPTGKYTMTINASQGEDPLTRALTTDGTNISATWTKGDLVSVYNVTKSAALGGTLSALSSGTTVKLSGELTGTIEAGDVLKLTYQTTDDFTGQNGTLEYILDNYDYATASITVSAVSDEKIIPTSTSVSFQNQLAIVKFTLLNSTTSAALNTSSIRISANGVAYTITPAGNGNVFYMAFPKFSYPGISLVTKVNGQLYNYAYYGTKAPSAPYNLNSYSTFDPGKYYEISVKMKPISPEYVDLGLPSGTLWATTNLGESAVGEGGYPYTLGETVPHPEFRYPGVMCPSIEDPVSGATDAATANWGTEWCMPTEAQWDELLNTANATRSYITTYTKGGIKFTSTRNSNFIFLPYCGLYADNGIPGGTSYGYYRSSTGKHYEIWNPTSYGKNRSNRLGLQVRPVRAQ